MGIEFKVIACSVVGILVYIEVQEGKLPMRKNIQNYLVGLLGTQYNLLKAQNIVDPIERNAERMAKKAETVKYGMEIPGSLLLPWSSQWDKYFGALKKITEDVQSNL